MNGGGMEHSQTTQLYMMEGESTQITVLLILVVSQRSKTTQHNKMEEVST